MINETIEATENIGNETKIVKVSAAEFMAASALALGLAILSVCFIFYSYHKSVAGFMFISGVFMIQGVLYIPNVISNSSLRAYFLMLFITTLILGSIIFIVIKFY